MHLGDRGRWHRVPVRGCEKIGHPQQADDFSRNQRGLLAALADRRINRALQAIHGDPAAPWSVESLGKEAGMSRAAFANRFNEVMGMAPMAYATHWRMQLAYEMLRAGDLSVAAVAERCGYRAEVAFRKAFKRHVGVGPGTVRRQD